MATKPDTSSIKHSKLAASHMLCSCNIRHDIRSQIAIERRGICRWKAENKLKRWTADCESPKCFSLSNSIPIRCGFRQQNASIYSDKPQANEIFSSLHFLGWNRKPFFVFNCSRSQNEKKLSRRHRETLNNETYATRHENNFCVWSFLIRQFSLVLSSTCCSATHESCGLERCFESFFIWF